MEVELSVPIKEDLTRVRTKYVNFGTAFTRSRLISGLDLVVMLPSSQASRVPLESFVKMWMLSGREYRDQKRRIGDLEQEVRDGYAAAAPFVAFCQRRYDIARQEREVACTALTDCQEALADCLDNARELEGLRERFAHAQTAHAEDVGGLQSQIGDLTSQISVIQAAAISIPPELGRRLNTLQDELLAVKGQRDQAFADLLQAEEATRTFETSQQALEDATSRLQNQVASLERRLAAQSVTTTAEVRNLTSRLDQSHAELDRWRQAAEETTSTLSATTNALQSMTTERVRVTASLLTTLSGGNCSEYNSAFRA
ncbi:Hypothetical protein PHPALM_12519 [Phytophthora palmivora]|uniref:Uncharacterized protein n=1 Tax=Phytophthora palmivora TaxID=4796 RepID=A0A2P4XZK6_9STRA|nr:Hypothetical protein PHPALM_12519 [Phytophthora palmivora]